MRTEARVFDGLMAFFIVTCVGYTWATYWDEPAGSIALGVSAGFSAAIAFYLRRTGKHADPRPEDDSEGSDTLVEGEYGTFSPESYWPVLVALAAFFATLGVALGWWITILDAPFAALAVVGWSIENFRG